LNSSSRTIVVTGAASGIGAATTRYLRDRGNIVVTTDLHDADIVADLAVPEGRAALVDGVRRLARGKIDAVIANAGGGPPETSVALNFFGAVATLEGLRPLLCESSAPRAVAVSSVASLRPPIPDLLHACLSLDESAAESIARAEYGRAARPEANPLPDRFQAPLDLYGTSKLALQRWCRATATTEKWAGNDITLNVVAFGFVDTPAAAYVLADPENRAAMAEMIPLKSAYPGRVEQAAAILAWFVGAENALMTGQVVFADAGLESLAIARATSAQSS
jgi:NAD(P)-dependent dehydrogenase (short-subunit alcohol dehydrogenase family)